MGIKTTIPSDKSYFMRIKDREKPANQKKYQLILEKLLYISRITCMKASIQVNLLGW